MAVRKRGEDLAAEMASSLPTTPKLTEVADCGGAAIKSVGSSLGCGAEGCAWRVTMADGEDAIIKVAKFGKPAEVALKKDCKFANALQEAGVKRALKCHGSCMSAGSPAAVLSPFVKNKMEFGPNVIRLGKNNEHAVVEMLKTTWQMLHGGFVNVDQANNVLYYPETGDPVFIDFGRARRVTKALTGRKKMILQVQIDSMLWDLIGVTVPPNLCLLAQTTVAQLQKDLPPSPFLKDAVESVLNGKLATKWETCQA